MPDEDPSNSFAPPTGLQASVSGVVAREVVVVGDVATVLPGLTLRGPEAGLSSSQGNFLLLRIGDLDLTGTIQITQSSHIYVEPDLAEKYRLRPGDIVLANRGSRVTAGLFQSPLPAVAGNQFYIVRVRAGVVLPEYLLWFLNLESTRRTLMAEARGSFVHSIPVAAVRELPVPVPSLQVQQRIVSISELERQESELSAQILSLRRTLLAELLKRIATGRHNISHQPTQTHQ